MNISGLIILYLAVFVTLVGLVSALITIHSFFEAHRHPKIKQRPIIVSIVFIASMFVLAAILTPVSCVVGKTSTSEPSPTTNNQTPTALPSPTASPQSSTTSVPISPTATYGGTLVLDDPLKDNSHGYNWDKTDGHCTFKGGAYLVATSNPNNYECNTNSSRTDFSNFSYQVTMKLDLGIEGGICFRFIANDQTGYCFFVDQNVQYVLEKVYFNAAREDVIARGPSNFFVTVLANPIQLAVRAQGSAIDLFLNGHLIRSATDSTFSHGQIGVFLVYPGYFTQAEFTDAKVWI